MVYEQMAFINFQWLVGYMLQAHAGQVAPTYTLDESHRTWTTKIVQADKSVEENIKGCKEMKIWDQTMYLQRK